MCCICLRLNSVLFSQNKPATSNQPVVLFSQNKPAPAINHQPNEHAATQLTRTMNDSFIWRGEMSDEQFNETSVSMKEEPHHPHGRHLLIWSVASRLLFFLCFFFCKPACTAAVCSTISIGGLSIPSCLPLTIPVNDRLPARGCLSKARVRQTKQLIQGSSDGSACPPKWSMRAHHPGTALP
jgi:hypothetical protein